MNAKRSAGLLAALGLALVPTVRADEIEIPIGRLPVAVADAAREKFSGATWKKAAREMEGARIVYEIEMVHAGFNKDVTFTERGELVVVEAEIPASKLPEAASKAIKDKYPGATFDLVESVTKGPELKKDADAYEVHLTTADKKKIEVEVDARGKILEVED